MIKSPSRTHCLLRIFPGEVDPLRDIVRIQLFVSDSRALVRDPIARTRRDVRDVSIFAAEEFVSVPFDPHVDTSTVAAGPIERAALHFWFRSNRISLEIDLTDRVEALEGPRPESVDLIVLQVKF